MNTTKVEPVKDANLPSTSQSLMPQENVNICELMDLIDSDGFSNESVEDVDINYVAEFESLFKNVAEDLGVGNSQKILPSQDTGLSAASDSNENTELTTDSDLKANTGLPIDSDLKVNTGLPTDSNVRLNTGLSLDSHLKVNTGLPADSDVRLNTGLSVDSDLKVNTGLPADSDVRLNTGLLVDSDLEMNAGLLTENDLKLNTELLTDSKLKTVNTGSSADRFASGAEGKTVNDVEVDVQLKPSSADIEENNDNVLAVTESCVKHAETSNCSKDTAPISNQSEELTVTSFCDVSKHIGSTAAGQPLLNRSPVPATVTLQALDIPQHSGGLETVDTAAYDDAGTADGEMIISVQSVTKQKVEMNSSNLMTCDSTSAEKSFGVLNAEISHSMTNGDNILTENRTDVTSAEVGTPKVTPYAARDTGEHSCTSIRDQNAVSVSPELLSVGETSCSSRVADKVVSEKKGSDGIAEVGRPVSIACTAREVLDHSYFKVQDENETVVTKHSSVSENSVPVIIDIEDMIQPLSVPDTGSLTADVLSVALDDKHVTKNVTVSSYENVNMPCGTEIKETVVRETNLSTAENMFLKMNSITDVGQQNIMIHAGTEVTGIDSDQATASGVPIMLEKLISEGNSHTLQTNCIPDAAAEMANLKSDNICVGRYTGTKVFGKDILERLPDTTKARHTVTPKGNNTGMDCPQFPVVSSGLQQKETGNRTHLQKPELFAESGAQSLGMNRNSKLELDGHWYSCSTDMKNEGGLTDTLRPSGTEVKNALVADSKNHAAPQTVRIGKNLNSCVVACRENVPLPDLSKMGGKVVSASYVNPPVSPTYPPHQQNLNRVQPLYSNSSAAVSQKQAKRHMTASKTEQNKTSDICTSLQVLFSKPNDVKLGNTRQSKLDTKEATINKIRSCLKPQIAFPDSNKGKFAGFIFEKPSVPGPNLRLYSKNKKISKTQGLPKGRRTYSEQSELLLTLTSNPHPDPLNCNSSSTDSNNRVTLLQNYGSVEDIKVENKNVADHVYVKNASDDGSLDWLQQLLM
ncbi:hypothetical protein Cfor_07789 [Coptotermes formosanus]|jgi:hypothetical protein|uniref:Uncharacterized protein n=1 Tax=Coptotermes formosanus TaxID=36987 RepID=A0A6L2PH41_COPFO|nr:hypothetical protein Cfor_07789 [Coptotermes formosanus]